MPTGMQVFDDFGRLSIDLTRFVSVHQGSVVTGAAPSGTITMPPLPAGRSRFYYSVGLVSSQGYKGKLPGITVSGNSLTWQYLHSTWFGQFSMNCEIFYGYF